MPRFCCIIGCTNTDKVPGRSFYRIPKVCKNQGVAHEKLLTERRNLWFSRISRMITSNPEHWRVCGNHFVSGAPSKLYDKANPDWAPTQQLGHTKFKSRLSSPRKSERKHERTAPRPKRAAEVDAAMTLHQMRTKKDAGQATVIPDDGSSFEASSVAAGSECQGHSTTSSASQTDITSDMISLLQEKLNCILEERVALKKKLNNMTINEDYFRGNDEKVSFYTGVVGFQTLITLFSFIEKDVFVNHNSVLSAFQQLILTLMKLRLNLSVQDLAYRFGISSRTSSKIFLMMLDILYIKLGFLVRWPPRDELGETMPMCFREEFGNKVAVIIDAFEIFLERPSNLLAQAQTWLSYKHHNTIKFFIGISPQGAVSFISKGWVGRTSDKYVTENSGFLDHITPGDVILANRGFDIADSISLLQATLVLPAFMGERKQLSSDDVISTRSIANVHIHVERVINLVRQRYKILGGPVPMDYTMKVDENQMTTLDKVAVVCCALTNFSPSVVNIE